LLGGGAAAAAATKEGGGEKKATAPAATPEADRRARYTGGGRRSSAGRIARVGGRRGSREVRGGDGRAAATWTWTEEPGREEVRKLIG